MRWLERHPVPPGRNSLRVWHTTRSRWRVLSNYMLANSVKFSPSLRLKAWFARRMGVRVGRDASIAQEVQLDFFFPELIDIGENAIIGFRTVLLTHEFLQNEWRRGPIKIGKNALVGANCTILPGVTIGDGAIVGAGAVVTSDIPPGAFAAGVPARVVKRTRNR